MRKSGSRMSLNDRLPTLDERRLSEAEKVCILKTLLDACLVVDVDFCKKRQKKDFLCGF